MRGRGCSSWMNTERSRVGDLELNWIQTGPRDAATVLLIHAVGFDLSYWDRQIEALLADFNVIAFDLPGHGRSAGGSELYRFDRVAEFVARLVDSAGCGPVHLVGISFGSMVAQITALVHPEIVKSLTLSGTAARFPDAVRDGMRSRATMLRNDGTAAVLKSSLERWFTSATMLRRPDVIDRVSKTILNDNPYVQAAVWDFLANEFDVQDQLHKIRCPTLVLVGEHDPSTPPSTAAAIAETIEGAEMPCDSGRLAHGHDRVTQCGQRRIASVLCPHQRTEASGMIANSVSWLIRDRRRSQLARLRTIMASNERRTV